jgi:hypothetical protein
MMMIKAKLVMLLLFCNLEVSRMKMHKQLPRVASIATGFLSFFVLRTHSCSPWLSVKLLRCCMLFKKNSETTRCHKIAYQFTLSGVHRIAVVIENTGKINNINGQPASFQTSYFNSKTVFDTLFCTFEFKGETEYIYMKLTSVSCVLLSALFAGIVYKTLKFMSKADTSEELDDLIENNKKNEQETNVMTSQ